MIDWNHVSDDIKIMTCYKSGQDVKVHQYIENIIDTHPNVKVHIGTDSQYKAGYAYYATVIAFRLGKRGVKGLYKKYKVDFDTKIYNNPKIVMTDKQRNQSIKKRLRLETNFSLIVANHVKEVIDIEAIDLDYNIALDEENNPLNISYHVINDCRGYCKGMQFHSTVKNEILRNSKGSVIIGTNGEPKTVEQVATHFADKICRKNNNI